MRSTMRKGINNAMRSKLFTEYLNELKTKKNENTTNQHRPKQ
jgi:hypothetical protein